MPPSNPQLAAESRSIPWIDMMPMYEGEYPHTTMTLLPMMCQHCEHPPCIKVCPVGATFFSESEGIVGQVYPRCIGCRYCTNACPYTVRQFNWFPPDVPEPYLAGTNPDVSVRYKGVVEKCTFCNHRLMKARDTANGGGPRSAAGRIHPRLRRGVPHQGHGIRQPRRPGH